MQKIKLILLSLMILIIPVISLGATGHVNGCPNTGTDINCCQKTYIITPDEGYEVIDVLVNGESKGAISSYTFSDLVGTQALQVLTEACKFTIEYVDPLGGTVPESQEKSYNQNINLSSDIPSAARYTFLGWEEIKDEETSVLYQPGDTFTGNYNVTLRAKWESSLGFNEPVLGEGMTPINFDTTQDGWVATTEDNWVYNYNKATI